MKKIGWFGFGLVILFCIAIYSGAMFFYISEAVSQTEDAEEEIVSFQYLAGGKKYVNPLETSVYLLKYEGRKYLVTGAGYIIEHRKEIEFDGMSTFEAAKLKIYQDMKK